MATLRVTLLVATLLGLALLAAPSDAEAGPIVGATAYSKCHKDWHPCIYHRQRCAECVVSCDKVPRTSPLAYTADKLRFFCRRVHA